MRARTSPFWIIALLLTCCITLATTLQPRLADQSENNQGNNIFKLLLGDGRRLFANEFFTMADVYFHSGYYPSIFDRQENRPDIVAAVHGQTDNDEDSTNVDFFGAPKDWIDSFGWRFKLDRHTHLTNGKEREILPWLQLAAEMNPQKVETYTIGAYFLRTSLDKTGEAEAFLREGLRNNPNNCDIMFELGRLEYDGYHNVDRARNIWELALRQWQQKDANAKADDRIVYEEIVMNLARLERENGRGIQAVQYLEMAKKVSPAPDALQKQIDDIRRTLTPDATTSPAH